MPRNKWEIEFNVEDAIMAYLDDQTEITCAIRRWRDASQSEVYPVALVHCLSAQAEGADTSLSGSLLSCSVEIGARTSVYDDKSRETCSAWLGKLRSAMIKSGILSSLNTKTTLLSFIGIEFAGGISEGDADNLNTMSFSIEFHVHVA